MVFSILDLRLTVFACFIGNKKKRKIANVQSRIFNNEFNYQKFPLFFLGYRDDFVELQYYMHIGSNEFKPKREKVT